MAAAKHKVSFYPQKSDVTSGRQTFGFDPVKVDDKRYLSAWQEGDLQNSDETCLDQALKGNGGTGQQAGALCPDLCSVVGYQSGPACQQLQRQGGLAGARLPKDQDAAA